MAAKPKSKKKQSESPAVALSAVSAVVTRNLANMATIFASTGTVLLCLLIAKRF
ncbi:hypothetical protein [Rhodopseudomonas sp. B29]|uniref:hypothetical protein n=1 Tax=Rhodopseudomonas sp. B29 TaxID=95607 RepID=UPI000345E22B|nr:hypothetical protein [Rhodopseudomonas sp. B29]